MTGRPWLQAGWTGQPRPVPIQGPVDLRAAIDAVLRIAGAEEIGEVLRVSRGDGAELEVWLDIPARGGWAFSFTDPAGQVWLTGSGPLRVDEPGLDFRYHDAWNQLPRSSFLPANVARQALNEFLATGRMPTGFPWRPL